MYAIRVQRVVPLGLIVYVEGGPGKAGTVTGRSDATHLGLVLRFETVRSTEALYMAIVLKRERARQPVIWYCYKDPVRRYSDLFRAIALR
jgi:hypothetical protein